jgi:hypothetical protein
MVIHFKPFTLVQLIVAPYPRFPFSEKRNETKRNKKKKHNEIFRSFTSYQIFINDFSEAISLPGAHQVDILQEGMEQLF